MTSPFLERALDGAHARLRDDPAGELPLGRRQLVWSAMGPREGEPGRPSDGRVRRTRLAVAACRVGLPLWDRERPGEGDAAGVLDLAEGALTGVVSEQDAKTAAGRLWGRTENLGQLAGDPSRIGVGFACCAAVDVALYDEWFDPADLDPERSAALLDVFEVDTAFHVAVAVAGGMPGAAGADVPARRAFWTWWLEEAAAAAGAPVP